MKLTAGKRVLMFIHWLLSLLICAAFAFYIVRPDIIMGLYNAVTARLTPVQIMIIGISLLAIYVIFAVIQAFIIFRRGKRDDRGFITVDSSDSGRVRIAVSAIEHMVRHSVTNIDGIDDMRIDIESMDDAIAINIAAVLKNGCHVPTVTMNMQQAIRKFVEMNCGVAVRMVSISINAVNNTGDGLRRRGRKAHAEVASAPMPQSYAPEEPTVYHTSEAEPVASEAVSPKPFAVAQEPEQVQPVNEPTEFRTVAAEQAQASVQTQEASEPIRLHLDYANAYGENAQRADADDEGYEGDETPVSGFDDEDDAQDMTSDEADEVSDETYVTEAETPVYTVETEDDTAAAGHAVAGADDASAYNTGDDDRRFRLEL